MSGISGRLGRTIACGLLCGCFCYMCEAACQCWVCSVALDVAWQGKLGIQEASYFDEMLYVSDIEAVLQPSRVIMCVLSKAGAVVR